MGSINVMGGGFDLRKFLTRQWAYPSVNILVANTYQTLLEVTGASGYLTKIVGLTTVGKKTYSLRLTIDGVVFGTTNVSANHGPTGFATPDNFYGGGSYGSLYLNGAKNDGIVSGLVGDFFNFTVGDSVNNLVQLSQPIFFKNSFKVEVKHETTGVSMDCHVVGGIKI